MRTLIPILALLLPLLTPLLVAAPAAEAETPQEGSRPGPQRLEVRRHTHGPWTVSQILEWEGPFVDPAHTPGSLLFDLAGEDVWFVGDLFHHPAQIARPEWKSASFDVDPGLVALERRKYLTLFATTDAIVYAAHVGDPYQVALTGKATLAGRIWPASE